MMMFEFLIYSYAIIALIVLYVFFLNIQLRKEPNYGVLTITLPVKNISLMVNPINAMSLYQYRGIRSVEVDQINEAIFYHHQFDRGYKKTIENYVDLGIPFVYQRNILNATITQIRFKDGNYIIMIGGNKIPELNDTEKENIKIKKIMEKI